MNWNWDGMPPEEAVRILKSNSTSGLSHKEARARYCAKKGQGERDFFYTPPKSVLSILGSCLSDFLLWTILLTCTSLAFFEKTALAAVGLIFLLFGLAFSVLTAKRSSAFLERVSFAFVPQIRIIREGKLLSTDHRSVVRGDVVLLSEGDVIPFDARILSADRLIVSVYCGKDPLGQDVFVTAKKDPTALFTGNGVPEPQNRSNMVTAGSSVLSGSARVLVTETGSFTYIGALTGGVSVLKSEDPARSLRTVRSNARKIGVLILILTVPMMVLSFLFSGAESPALSFVTVLSLSCAMLTGWIGTIYEYFAVSFLDRETKRQNQFLIRTVTATEKIAATDVLLLFGRSMITDGMPRVAAVFAEGKSYGGKAMRRDACRRLTEKAMLLVIAARKLPASVGEAFDPKDLYRDELMTFSGFVGADMEMAEIRYRLLEYRSSTRMHSTELLRYVDTAEDASECVLMCSPDELLYVRCTHIFTKTGKQVLTFERRVEIKQELRKFLSRGCEIRSYAEKEQNGDVTFLGFIAYAERIRKETVHAFGALSDLGIRSFLILDGESAEDHFYALASGACRSEAEIAYASEFRRQNLSITNGYGRFGAYLGFSSADLKELIAYLHSKKLLTCGISANHGDAPLLSALSLSLVPGEPKVLPLRRVDQSLTEMPIGGVPHVTDTGGEMKLSADGIIRRSSKQGSGLSAILAAIGVANQISSMRRTFLTYLSFFAAFAFGWLFPALFGLNDLYGALALMFNTLVLNSIFALLLSRDVGIGGGKRNGHERTGKSIGIAFGCCFGIGVLLSVIPALLSLFENSVTAEKIASFRSAALILSSTVLFVRTRAYGIGKFRFDRSTVLCIVLCLSILILISLFPQIGLWIGMPSLSGVCVLLLPIAVLLPLFLPPKKFF